jgi:hypothetical protein
MQMIDNQALSTNSKIMFGGKTAAVETATSAVKIDATNNAGGLALVLPLAHMSINTKVPLIGNDGLRIRLHWGSALNSFVQLKDDPKDLVAGSLTFTLVRLHYDVVKLSNEDMVGLYNELDGRFVITGNDYASQSEVMNSTSLTANLGFGRTKCKKIYAVSRTTVTLAAAEHSSHSFSVSELINAELRFNGRLINESSLSFTNASASVAFAEAMKSNGGSFFDSNNYGGGCATTAGLLSAADVAVDLDAKGCFIMEWDLTNGLDTSMGESGLDTRTGTFQLVLTASNNPASTVTIFCEYENEIILDTKADNVFRVRS